MAQNFNLARNDLARVFIFEKGCNICQCPDYYPCISVDSLAQDIGDITRIECPDPLQYGKFVEVGNFPGEVSRLTTTLTTHMSRTERSQFYRWFRQGCSLEMHIHYGLCQRPNAFNEFDKALILTDVQITSFGTDPLVALTSSDRATITETIDISASELIEYTPVSYGLQSTITDATAVDMNLEAGGFCHQCECDSCKYRIYGISDANKTSIGTGYFDGYTYSISNNNQLTEYDTENNITNGYTFALSENILSQDYTPYAVIVAGENGFLGYMDSRWNITELESNTINNIVVAETASTTCDVYLGATGGEILRVDSDYNVHILNSPTTLEISAIGAIDDNNLIVADTSGNFYKTCNCGEEWEEILTSVTAAPSKIKWCDCYVGYIAVGTTLYTTYDKACSWNKHSFTGIDNIVDIGCCLHCTYIFAQQGTNAVIIEGCSINKDNNVTNII